MDYMLILYISVDEQWVGMLFLKNKLTYITISKSKMLSKSIFMWNNVKYHHFYNLIYSTFPFLKQGID